MSSTAATASARESGSSADDAVASATPAAVPRAEPTSFAVVISGRTSPDVVSTTRASSEMSMLAMATLMPSPTTTRPTAGPFTARLRQRSRKAARLCAATIHPSRWGNDGSVTRSRSGAQRKAAPIGRYINCSRPVSPSGMPRALKTSGAPLPRRPSVSPNDA